MAIGDKKPVVMEFDRAVPGGVATLDKSGKLADDQRPDYKTSQVEGLDKALSRLGDEVTALQTGKQDKLTGSPGQLIGIGDDGEAQATVYPSSRNMLDNAHWMDKDCIINQRNEDEYTAESTNMYTIDRWYLQDVGGKITVESDGIVLSCNGSYAHFIQIIEPKLIDQQITFSVMLGDNTVYSVTVVATSGEGQKGSLVIIPGGYFFIYRYGKGLGVAIRVDSGNSVHLKAAKLELGPVQTLAHKEGDTWVLNDQPPNYALELAKCQRYYQQSWVGSPLSSTNKPADRLTKPAMTSARLESVRFPVTMRANPTVTLYSGVTFTENAVAEWESDSTIEGCVALYTGPNGFLPTLQKPDFEKGNFYSFFYTASADL